MTPRERAKRVQELTAKAMKMPTPGRVLEVVGEVSVLLGEWGEILERIERASNEQRDTSGKTEIRADAVPGAERPGQAMR